MKLTITFLAALAAADAAEARSHRQARRAYGQPYGGSGGYGDVSSAKPIETPSPSSVAVPYIQSSAEAFKTSSPPNAVSSYPPTEATPSPPAGGEGYPTNPEVPVGGKSSTVPAGVESSSAPVVVPVATPSSSAVPAESSPVSPPKGGEYGNGYPVESPKTPAAATPSSSVTPAGVYPSSSVAPSGAYPSGGYGSAESSSAPVKGAESSSKPVKDAVSSLPYGSGIFASGAGYPTGTGSSPASSTPLIDYVTKTIYSTQIKYESSSLVTSVVPVGTTVCAADEASKTPSPSVPVKVTSEVPVSEVVKTLTETLVYTVGVGSTAHPVTTEVVTTSTSTVYKTIVVTVGKNTKPSNEQTATPVGYPEGPTGTSTLTSTSTSTKYITIKPTPSGSVPVGQEGYPVGGAGKPVGGKGGEDCAVPVTVTVTAKETVYVTKGQDKPAATPGSGYPATPEAQKPVSSGTPYKPSGGAGKPTKPSATPVGGMYPIGNGTNPYPAGPTGFQTSAKPGYPVGTGVPTKPSATSSLPYFSFVSEAATPEAATPSAVKTPSVETQVPYAPASTPAAPKPSAPAGGEYGSGYEVPAVPAASSSAKPVETPATPSSKVPSPAATPTPAGNGYGNGYGSGYGTY